MGSVESETASPSAASASAAHTPAAGANADPRRASGDSSSALTAKDLTFDLLQNAAYHSDRLAHFAGTHRVVSFITILFGTGAVAGAIASCPWLAGVSGVLTAVASSLDLAMDLAGQARLHEKLRERVFALMADVEEAGDDPARLRAIRGSLTRLFGEEAADMCVVNAMAHNAAVQATQRPVNPDDLIPLTAEHKRWRHWRRQPGDYLTAGEIARAKVAAGG